MGEISWVDEVEIRGVEERERIPPEHFVQGSDSRKS